MQFTLYTPKMRNWHRVSVAHDISDQAMDWCEITPGDKFTIWCSKVLRIDFYFKDVKDAVLFKLTWA